VGTESSFNSNQTFFNISNNILYFDATDGVTGTELWKTDGSTAGTVLVKDINPGPSSSNPTGFTTMGTAVYFSANDGVDGTELWKSDGTDAGTVLVQDIVNGGGGSSPQQFVIFQNKLFFLTSSGFPLPSYKLFSSDGTDAGTVLVKSFGTGAFPIISLSVIINNKLYFSNFAVTNGLELWYSDGTTNGTTIFKDINPGSASSNAFILPNFSSLYNGGSGDFHNALFNGKIFFMADDGTNGLELWITDGTDGGTVMVKDINPGTGSSLGDGLSWFYTSTGLYFAGDNGTSGTELFFSDGTEGNTDMVSDINAGASSSDPVLFMFLNNHVYCTADNGDGGGDRDLYIIDADVVLPVAMLNFTATLSGKSVDLKWSTASESNTKNFVVQRSYDGVNFRNIGTVNAAGNSASKKDYSFADASALNGSATIYYRLQVVDKDGKTSNSKIAMVNITSGGAIVTLYPNPVKDRLNFITSNTLSNVQVRITDKSGKIVLAQKITTVQAGQLNTINVAALARGSYYMQLISDNNKQTTQFIKF
jgi:ELWxxDGT repeat protein